MSHFMVHFFAVFFFVLFLRGLPRKFLISRLTEEVNKRGQIFLPLFKFGSWQWESDCRKIFFLRGHICVAFDNARILFFFYKLRAFILLSMSGCLKKQLVYFNSFHGLRLVDFDLFWFLFPIHKVGVPSLLVYIKTKNTKLNARLALRQRAD